MTPRPPRLSRPPLFGVPVALVAALSLLSACSHETPQRAASADERESAPVTPRIVGGNTFSGLPAVGALTRYGSPFCTATVVGKRKLLTAAHCVHNSTTYGMAFAIGPDGRNPQASIPIASLQPHPAYSGASLNNDIALVTLAQDAPVTPMAAVADLTPYQGKELFFVGYGISNGYTGTGGGIKRAVWMRMSQLSATTFRYNDYGKNTCNGDSGGPAFVQAADGTFLVAGVTSYGDANCVSYGVDTRVDAYASFVGTTGAPAPPAPAPKPQDPCKGETFEGRCDGNTVVWCENQRVNRQDCSASNRSCTFDSGYGYYLCGQAAPPPAPVDPCKGETFEGRCDGNTVIWCEDEQIKSLSCASYGRQCGYKASKSYYGCL